MSIQVRFFASLADRVGKRQQTLTDKHIQTVEDVWTKCAQELPIPGNALVAINQQYAKFDSTVKDGDEIAFFPPVTGG